MDFLTKKEQSMIKLVISSEKMSQIERNEAVTKIKENARLRSDGYRKPVKVFLSVMANLRNEKIAKTLSL